MKTFYDVIVEICPNKISQLYGPSGIASEKPDTGVKVLAKPAYFVIRDCATITHQFLPLICWNHIQNPFETLSGKITKAQLSKFIEDSKKDISAKLLLDLILEQSGYTGDTQIDEFIPDDEDNIYGDYGYGSEEPTIKESSLLDILISIFSVN